MFLFFAVIKIIQSLAYILRSMCFSEKPGMDGLSDNFTIVIPIKNYTKATFNCIHSVLYYTNCQIVLCLEELESDYFQQLFKSHPDRIQLIWGPLGDRIRHPKLANLNKAWCRTYIKTKYVIMLDDNIRFQSRTLLDIADKLIREGKDVVSAGFFLSYSGHPLENAFINGLQLPWFFASDALNRGYVIAKMLAFEFDKVPDLKVLDSVGEDCALSKLAKKKGWSVGLIDVPLEHMSDNDTTQKVIDRQLRWLYTRRVEYPFLWLADPLSSTLVVAGIIWAFDGWLDALIYSALAYMAEFCFCAMITVVPMSLRWSLYRDALIPLLWIKSIFTRSVIWRGRECFKKG